MIAPPPSPSAKSHQAAAPRPVGFWRDAWRRFRRKPQAMLALAYVVCLLLVGLLAPVLVGTKPIVCRYKGNLYFPCLGYLHPRLENPIFKRDKFRVPFSKSMKLKDPESWAVYPLVYQDPLRRVPREEVDALRPPPKEPLAPDSAGAPKVDDVPSDAASEPDAPRYDGSPNAYHWMGATDATEVDVFAIIVHGAKIAMLIGFVTTGISAFIGITLGAVAGYVGGWVDIVISRATEFVMCIPVLILIITLLAVIDKPSIWHIMLVLGLTGWTGICRLTRGEFLKLRAAEYVTAARAIGAGLPRILFRHILPNALAPVLVPITFGIATAILTESGLSLLGLGSPPDTPSWGGLLNRGRENFETMWWLIFFPGLAIFSTVLAYNIIGEALQEVTDPRLREDAK